MASNDEHATTVEILCRYGARHDVLNQVGYVTYLAEL